MTVNLQTIPLERLHLSTTVSQRERRKYFRKEDLAELVESVKSHGVLQPIIVRTWNSRDANTGAERFTIVAGERRYLAAKAAGLQEVPAVVRDLTDEQVIEIQLIENLQRADLHPMQEAEGYHELMTVHFIWDAIIARELLVPSWSNKKAERLLALAKTLHIDVAAVKREVAPKKKATKKKAGGKKKPAARKRTKAAAAA